MNGPVRTLLTPTEMERISDRIDTDSSVPLRRFAGRRWRIAFVISLTLLGVFILEIALITASGLGLLGLNIPIGWGTFIINFVFWIGIGHAGTLISAILYLFRQEWRSAINRAAEAMTVMAVLCAAVFPLFHLGRAWLGYYLFPYPNSRGSLWPNFQSPLIWDAAAVTTYLTVSLIFWYLGLLPDFAAVRDRLKKTGRADPQNIRLYTLLALGWNGSTKVWAHYEKTMMILAGLSFPLVISVHSVVSYDFAISVVPGWHSTILPPYFVAGAVYSGFGMVLMLTLVLRRTLGLERYITTVHLDNAAKITLFAGLLVAFAYLTELAGAVYGQNPDERFAMIGRAFGPYRHLFWVMLVCNVLVPQLFWFQKMRRDPRVLFLVSFLINAGMWLERVVIVVTGLHRGHLRSGWGSFLPTVHDAALTLGSLGLFGTLFLLFVRYFPVLSLTEIKTGRFQSEDIRREYDIEET